MYLQEGTQITPKNQPAMPPPQLQTCKYMKKERYIMDHKGTQLATIPFKCTLTDVIYCLTCNICSQH